MSADRWSICPRCGVTEEQHAEQWNAKLADAYGKVTAAEYVAMTTEARKPYDPTESFREDWSIGQHKGEFYVSYTGACTECDLSHSFRIEQKLDLSQPDARKKVTR